MEIEEVKDWTVLEINTVAKETLHVADRRVALPPIDLEFTKLFTVAHNLYLTSLVGFKL